MSAPFDLASEPYKAALFDLDGVLTFTARIHADAWKQMFDAFLSRRAQTEGLAVQPFEIATDYVEHVDGKPRLDGVRDFLAARGITLPLGNDADPPGTDTVRGLGNAKNDLVQEAIQTGKVELDPATKPLLERLKAAGWKLAVVSSSRNTRAVLDVVGLADRFEACVDGQSAEILGLPGKPAPDTFLEAARQLDMPPALGVVLEDATSGVATAKAGGFGLVVGIDRKGRADALKSAGADRVVGTLADLLSKTTS